MDLKENTGIRGRFRLQIHDPDGNLVEERESNNVMCAGGLTIFAQVVNYFGVLDQNTAMGTPFTYQDLTPIYGAVGTSATAPTDADTILGTEVARAIVYAGATSSAISGGTDATVTWSFFYGAPGVTRTIAECGVFVNATSSSGTGTLLDHALISPTVSWSSANSATLQLTLSIGNV